MSDYCKRCGGPEPLLCASCVIEKDAAERARDIYKDVVDDIRDNPKVMAILERYAPALAWRITQK